TIDYANAVRLPSLNSRKTAPGEGGISTKAARPAAAGQRDQTQGGLHMTISRRTLIAALGGLPAAALLARGAFAAGWPERPVHLIVPFAAGGNADIVGRLAGDMISKGIGQTVVVENRGGAGGSIGAAFVARSHPDGYMLLVGSNGPLTVNPLVQAHMEYDPQKDLAPIAL